MAPSTPTCFQTSETQQPSTSVQRPEDELAPAHNFIVIDLDELYDTDYDTDESEDLHITEVNILEQLLLEKRLRESGAVPSRKGLIPDTPYDHSIAHLAQELRACGAELDAVEYLIDEVWPGGNITLEGLMAPMGDVELRVSGLAAGSAKYLALFRRQDRVGLCRLCPLDSPLDFKQPETGLYHITKDHFDMGYGCQCGWCVLFRVSYGVADRNLVAV